MYTFKLLVGCHEEGGVVYNAKTNPVVRSPLNLIEICGAQKFALLGEDEPEKVKVSVPEPKAKPKAKPEPIDENDVTSDFNIPDGLEAYRVLARGGSWFDVYDEEGAKVNEKGIRAKTVQTLLHGLV